MSIFSFRLVCDTKLWRSTLPATIWSKNNNRIFNSLVAWFARSSTSSEVVLDKEKHSVISYFKDGKGVGLRPDEDYPDWLWQLKTEKQTMEGLDPHSSTFQRLYHKKQRRDENERRKMKRF